jgi:hypothetical protein
MKINDFSWIDQKLMSQDKKSPQNVETGKYRRSQLRSVYLYLKLLEPLTDRKISNIILTDY